MARASTFGGMITLHSTTSLTARLRVAVAIGIVGAALFIFGSPTTIAQAQLASAATLRTNPNESCKIADANNEEKRCVVKNVCVQNDSGATLKVWISAKGRAWTGDAPAVDIMGGQKTCRGIYAYSQEGLNSGIGILDIKAYNGAEWVYISMQNTAGSSTWENVDYGTETPPTVNGQPNYPRFSQWPAGGNGMSRPGGEPGNDMNDSNWTLTVYGHVWPSFNFCGKTNNRKELNETPLTTVKPCVWSTSR